MIPPHANSRFTGSDYHDQSIEIARSPLLFLATAASSYMTVQALVVDGGWTAV